MILHQSPNLQGGPLALVLWLLLNLERAPFGSFLDRNEPFGNVWGIIRRVGLQNGHFFLRLDRLSGVKKKWNLEMKMGRRNRKRKKKKNTMDRPEFASRLKNSAHYKNAFFPKWASLIFRLCFAPSAGRSKQEKRGPSDHFFDFWAS